MRQMRDFVHHVAHPRPRLAGGRADRTRFRQALLLGQAELGGLDLGRLSDHLDRRGSVGRTFGGARALVACGSTVRSYPDPAGWLRCGGPGLSGPVRRRARFLATPVLVRCSGNPLPGSRRHGWRFRRIGLGADTPGRNVGRSDLDPRAGGRSGPGHRPRRPLVRRHRGRRARRTHRRLAGRPAWQTTTHRGPAASHTHERVATSPLVVPHCHSAALSGLLAPPRSSGEPAELEGPNRESYLSLVLPRLPDERGWLAGMDTTALIDDQRPQLNARITPERPTTARKTTPANARRRLSETELRTPRSLAARETHYVANPRM